MNTTRRFKPEPQRSNLRRDVHAVASPITMFRKIQKQATKLGYSLPEVISGDCGYRRRPTGHVPSRSLPTLIAFCLMDLADTIELASHHYLILEGVEKL